MVSLKNADDDLPRYMFLDHVAKDANYTLRYSDFRDFDHTLTVSFPTSLVFGCEVFTYDPAKPVFRTGLALFHATRVLSERTNLKLGYLDQVKKYALFVSIFHADVKYSFSSAGDMPKAVNFPTDENFKLTDSSIRGFSLAGTPACDYRQSTYYQHDTADPSLILQGWVLRC